MRRDRVGQLLFFSAGSLALALYVCTACSGLPAGPSTHEALGWSGKLPVVNLAHPVWGYFVQVFAGHYIALACASAALAAGLLAVVVNRYLGWRVSVGLTIAWIFYPRVWNAAVTGDRLTFQLLVLMLTLWLVSIVASWCLGWLRRFLASSLNVKLLKLITPGLDRKNGRGRLMVSWGVMVAAGLFALGSLTFHDYQLGEAATVYAQEVVAEAGERWIVLGGVCDDQIRVLRSDARIIEPYNFSDLYRTQLVEKVKGAWPGRDDYVLAAQISPATLVERVAKDLPESFYFMNGKSTTVEAWERRWTKLTPFLGSDDAVVPLLGRALAIEGNALANALQETGGIEAKKAAWSLYLKIYDHVDRGNFSALINLSEMIREGYLVSNDDRERVQRGLEDFFKDKRHRENALLIARLSGPIRMDANRLAKIKAEAQRRLAESRAAGKSQPLSKEIQVLLDGNAKMLSAADAGDMVRAGDLARRILSYPEWRGFAPANAVMGSIMASEGDYASSECFFRTALAGGDELAAVTYNDFADALIHLGKLDEAEQYARKAIAIGGDSFWLAKLTLAELLVERRQSPAEVLGLLREIAKVCPEPVRVRLRELRRKIATR